MNGAAVRAIREETWCKPCEVLQAARRHTVRWHPSCDQMSRRLGVTRWMWSRWESQDPPSRYWCALIRHYIKTGEPPRVEDYPWGRLLALQRRLGWPYLRDLMGSSRSQWTKWRDAGVIPAKHGAGAWLWTIDGLLTRDA